MATEEIHPDVLESKLSKKDAYDDNRSNSDVESYGHLVAAESDNEVKYRTCSWQKVSPLEPLAVSKEMCS